MCCVCVCSECVWAGGVCVECTCWWELCVHFHSSCMSLYSQLTSHEIPQLVARLLGVM